MARWRDQHWRSEGNFLRRHDVDDVSDVAKERRNVDAALFEHRGRVEPERLPGQLQVTTKLPFRDDELADDVLASLAIFPAENYGVRLDRFKAVKTKNHVLNDQY